MGPGAEAYARDEGVRAPKKRLCTPAAVGGKHLNSGIRGGLWDAKHYERMGAAVWLFGWLVHRQTQQRHGEGLVLRGKPLSYEAIAADTGFDERTLRRWMQTLRKHGYVSLKHSCYKTMVIRVLNAKKFTPAQLGFPMPVIPQARRNPSVSSPRSFPQENPQSYRPELAVTAAKNGRIKEGVEIERQKEKPRAHNPRPALPLPVVRESKPLQPQQVAYAQTAQLARSGEQLLRADRAMSLGDLREQLKTIAASKGFGVNGNYRRMVENAEKIAEQRSAAAAGGKAGL